MTIGSQGPSGSFLPTILQIVHVRLEANVGLAVGADRVVLVTPAIRTGFGTDLTRPSDLFVISQLSAGPDVAGVGSCIFRMEVDAVPGPATFTGPPRYCGDQLAPATLHVGFSAMGIDAFIGVPSGLHTFHLLANIFGVAWSCDTQAVAGEAASITVIELAPAAA